MHQAFIGGRPKRPRQWPSATHITDAREGSRPPCRIEELTRATHYLLHSGMIARHAGYSMKCMLSLAAASQVSSACRLVADNKFPSPMTKSDISDKHCGRPFIYRFHAVGLSPEAILRLHLPRRHRVCRRDDAEQDITALMGGGFFLPRCKAIRQAIFGRYRHIDGTF